MYIATLEECIGVTANIGTGVGLPSAVILESVFTVTATKNVTYLIGTVNENVSFRNRCGITATIDLLNADIASLNYDIGLFSGCCIVCQVTTAIYCSQFIGRSNVCTFLGNSCIIGIFGSSVNIASCCTVNGYCNVTLR